MVNKPLAELDGEHLPAELWGFFGRAFRC